MLADNCARHEFEHANGECRACRQRYCESCLVWTHGPKRPPMCIPCAIAAAGVRHSAAVAPAGARRGLFGRRRDSVPVHASAANGNGNGHDHGSRPADDEPVGVVIPGLRVDL